MMYKASIAKGIYWTCKAIHGSSSQLGETSKSLNTKNKSHDSQTGGVQFSQFKRILKTLNVPRRY